MAIKIEMLRCFQIVAQLGSIRAAAETLGRTPPAVSITLTHLEEHVGMPLFEAGRKNRLTQFGRAVLEEANRAVANHDRSILAIENLANAEAGHIRLAVTPTVSRAILPDVVSRYVDQYPNVRIEISDMDSAAVLRELEGDRVDIGVATIGVHGRLERKLLLSDNFGLVCPSHHPLAHEPTPLTWAHIDVPDLIANGLCKLVDNPEFQLILESAKLYVTNQASLLALTKAGVGITVLPRLAVPEDHEGISFLPLPSAGSRRDIHVVTPPRELLPPAAITFLRFLENTEPPAI